jgi:hypothetical protein
MEVLCKIDIEEDSKCKKCCVYCESKCEDECIFSRVNSSSECNSKVPNFDE